VRPRPARKRSDVDAAAKKVMRAKAELRALEAAERPKRVRSPGRAPDRRGVTTRGGLRLALFSYLRCLQCGAPGAQLDVNRKRDITRTL
jgi:hypothetical protein